MSDRVVAPFSRRAARVVDSRALGSYHLLTVLDGGGPRPEPGQFYMLSTASRWGADGERPYLPRAFSHARVREDGRLDFLLESVGPGTERLAGTAAGEEVWLVGPLGLGFAKPDTAGGSARPLLVAGGIGAAPILALSDDLGPDVPVMLGFRNAGYAEAASLFHAPPALATDDCSAGRHALVTELLREALDAGGSPTVFVCGPPSLFESVRVLCA